MPGASLPRQDRNEYRSERSNPAPRQVGPRPDQGADWPSRSNLHPAPTRCCHQCRRPESGGWVSVWRVANQPLWRRSSICRRAMHRGGAGISVGSAVCGSEIAAASSGANVGLIVPSVRAGGRTTLESNGVVSATSGKSAVATSSCDAENRAGGAEIVNEASSNAAEVTPTPVRTA